MGTQGDNDTLGETILPLLLMAGLRRLSAACNAAVCARR
jgi:hypothetical protein